MQFEEEEDEEEDDDALIVTDFDNSWSNKLTRNDAEGYKKGKISVQI